MGCLKLLWYPICWEYKPVSREALEGKHLEVLYALVNLTPLKAIRSMLGVATSLP